MDVKTVNFFVIIFGAFIINIIGRNNISLDKRRKYYIIIVCFVLAIQSGFRHFEVGADTMRYFDAFNRVILMEWSEIFNNFAQAYTHGTSKDPGYYLLTKIIQIVSTNFTFFLTLLAVFYYTSLGLFIYRNTTKMRDVIFAFILYVALFNIIALSGIRQQIATAIALFAYQHIVNKNHLKFFIIVLLGSTIHVSLLLVILFWGISLLPNKYIKYLYYIPLLLFPVVLQFGRSIVSLMASFLANDYYQAYAYSENEGNPWFYITLAILVSLSGLFFINKVISYNRIYKIYFAGIAMMTFFTPLITLHGSLMRVGQYFSLYMMFFIPLLINNLRTINAIKTIVLYSLIGILLFLSLKSPFNYYFYWQSIPQ